MYDKPFIVWGIDNIGYCGIINTSEADNTKVSEIMARYSDPRRPTSNGPKLIDNGRIVMKRDSEGRYTHTTREWREYEVVRIENGRWVWAEVGKQANDSYASKREACAALLEWVYGAGAAANNVTRYAW